MKLTLCNEVLGDMPFEQQFEFAQALGYEGLEIAPYTVNPNPLAITPKEVSEVNKYSSAAGLPVSGLHWLLVRPENLSITTSDTDIRQRTIGFMKQLITLCADLGGTYLVHGSPQQRRLPETGNDQEIEEARKRGIESWAAIAEAAENAGVTYCIEALAPPMANFVNTVAEAAEIVEHINSKAVLTMIDCSAARQHERPSVAELIAEWHPRGVLGHIHVNDKNRRGPGQGDDEFDSVVQALKSQDYGKWIGVEPFDYIPDGPAAAAFCSGFMRSLLGDRA